MCKLTNKSEGGVTRPQCHFNFPENNKVNHFQAVQWVSEFCQKFDYKIVVTSTWRRWSNYKDRLINGGLVKAWKFLEEQKKFGMERAARRYRSILMSTLNKKLAGGDTDE